MNAFRSLVTTEGELRAPIGKPSALALRDSDAKRRC
jgi:hypothetical protein